MHFVQLMHLSIFHKCTNYGLIIIYTHIVYVNTLTFNIYIVTLQIYDISNSSCYNGVYRTVH